MGESISPRLAEFVIEALGIDPERITAAEVTRCVRAVQEWADEVIGHEMDVSGWELQEHMIISAERYLARSLAVDVMERGYVMVSRPKVEYISTDGQGDLTYTRLKISVPVRKL